MNFYASHFQNSYINQCQGQSYALSIKSTALKFDVQSRMFHIIILCYKFQLSIVRLQQGHAQYGNQIMVKVIQWTHKMRSRTKKFAIILYICSITLSINTVSVKAVSYSKKGWLLTRIYIIFYLVIKPAITLITYLNGTEIKALPGRL